MSSRQRRRRWSFRVFAFLFILTSIPFSLLSQAPRVLVVPVSNESDSTQLDPVATTVTDTILLTLRLLDAYEVRRYDGFLGYPPSTEELSLLARSGPVESVLYGAVERSVGGAIELKLRVYDRARGDVVLREEAAAGSLLDVFQAADELTARVVSGFSGRRVAFGSLRLSPEGAADRPYEVYLDENLLGRSILTAESLLTGRHELRIVAETEMGREVVYQSDVTLEEGLTTTVRFSIPDYTEDQLAAAAAAAYMEGDLESLLAERYELEESWAALASGEREDPPDADSVSFALTVLNRLESYPDPPRMEEAAAVSPLYHAEELTRRGRRLLREEELEEGVASFREVAAIGASAPVGELAALAPFNKHYPETQYVAERWSEAELHRERGFASGVGLGLAATAIFLAFDYGHPAEYSSSGLYNGPQNVALLAGAGVTALWLGWDQDRWGDDRSLKRYGRRGELRDGEFLDSAVPGKLDLGVGVGFEYAQNIRQLTEPVDPAIGVENPEYTFLRRDPYLQLALYYQAGRRSSLGFHTRLVPSEQEIWSDEAHQIAETDPTRVIRTPLDTSFTWDHTRTGKWFTRLGIGYTLFVDETTLTEDIAMESNPEQIEAYYDTLLDDGEFLHAPSLTIGLGRFYGRRRRSPFEALFYYRLHAVYPPNGVLGEPSFHHAIGLSFGKRFRLGNLGTPAILPTREADAREGWSTGGSESPSDVAGDGGVTEARLETSGVTRRDWEEVFGEAEAQAQERYGPRRLAFFTDLGGLLTFGPRFGAAYDLEKGWTVGGYLRWTLYALPYLGLEPMPERVSPGISLRRYSAGTPREAGWFYGGSLEYRNNNYFHEESFRFDGSQTQRVETVSDGHILATLAEGGYRFVREGGRFIDVGAFLGVGLGNYEYADLSYDPNDEAAPPSSTSTSNFFSPWAGILISVGTPW